LPQHVSSPLDDWTEQADGIGSTFSHGNPSGDVRTMLVIASEGHRCPHAGKSGPLYRRVEKGIAVADCGDLSTMMW
jgi:hypothetical protein